MYIVGNPCLSEMHVHPVVTFIAYQAEFMRRLFAK